MSQVIFNALFICTGNSARSIIAEALLNSIGQGRFKAYSAGSHPLGVVNPYALEIIKNNRLESDGLRSKKWDEFATDSAPKMDFIFTVCDKAAGEECPVWPGQPMTAHWGVSDPVRVDGSDAEKMRAFVDTFRILNRRISLLTSLPIEKLTSLSLKNELEKIGREIA